MMDWRLLAAAIRGLPGDYGRLYFAPSRTYVEAPPLSGHGHQAIMMLPKKRGKRLLRAARYEALGDDGHRLLSS